MRQLINTFLAASLTLASSIAVSAPPKHLIVHNTTNLQSNAFIAGSIPSQFPTAGNSENRVIWTAVRLACLGHTTNGQCSALIKIGTDTAMPLDIGTVTLDLNSGNISPSQVNGNGYTLIVNGPGEATIIKD